jgi:hypothetical protein
MAKTNLKNGGKAKNFEMKIQNFSYFFKKLQIVLKSKFEAFLQS